MKNISDYSKKRVLIIGAQISGQGAKNALCALGAECSIYEDGDSEEIFNHTYDLIIVSPAIPPEHKTFEFAQKNNIPIFGELELGSNLFDGKIAAVTGTNGKTTTTALLGQMLQQSGFSTSVCGNIGKSFAQSAVFDNADFAVVEVSSFQLETIKSFRPDIACILNITPDHLDRHKTMRFYAEAKLKIAQNQTESDYLILSADGIDIEYLKDFCPKSKVIYTSVNAAVDGAYMQNERIYFMDEFICPRAYIRLLGNHNVSNALFAIAAAKLFGVSNESIIDVLTSFQPQKHRLSYVAEVNGKAYYNDSKGTNIGAALTAAKSMPSSTCLILGGSDKGYEFEELFLQLPPCIKTIYAIGETAPKILKAAKKCGFSAITQKDSIKAAVKDSQKEAVENILLSPACASFDMFKDYKDRGEQFEKAVKELIK